MSVFNLDRFRFDKQQTATTDKEQDTGSISPESEKENKPGEGTVEEPWTDHNLPLTWRGAE